MRSLGNHYTSSTDWYHCQSNVHCGHGMLPYIVLFDGGGSRNKRITEVSAPFQFMFIFCTQPAFYGFEPTIISNFIFKPFSFLVYFIFPPFYCGLHFQYMMCSKNLAIRSPQPQACHWSHVCALGRFAWFLKKGGNFTAKNARWKIYDENKETSVKSPHDYN